MQTNWTRKHYRQRLLSFIIICDIFRVNRASIGKHPKRYLSHSWTKQCKNAQQELNILTFFYTSCTVYFVYIENVRVLCPHSRLENSNQGFSCPFLHYCRADVGLQSADTTNDDKAMVASWCWCTGEHPQTTAQHILLLCEYNHYIIEYIQKHI